MALPLGCAVFFPLWKCCSNIYLRTWVCITGVNTLPINSFDNYPMSWKPKLPKTNRPLYLVLAEQLEEDIKNDILLPGTKLPPWRELADYLDLNVSTVSRAFKVCKQKGLLSSTVGSGTFVSYDALASLSLLPDYHSSGLIDMGTFMPESIACSEIVKIVKEMMDEAHVSRLFGYGEEGVRDWQKIAAVKLIKKAGFCANADNLLPANGGQNAVTAILAGLFKAGDKIGTDPLTYPGLKGAAKLLGIQLVPIKQENNEICEEGLLYACKNEKIKAVFIMPDFQNPTTHIMTEECRRMIARVAKEQEILIIEDAAHSLLMEKPMDAVASYLPEQTVYIASLSKVVAPGLRLSYIVAPEHCKAALAEALYTLNLTTSPLLLELSSRIIVSGKMYYLSNLYRNLIKERNRIVDEVLNGYMVYGSEESIFRWLILPEEWTGEEFEEKAYKAGVQVYGSRRFSVGKAKPIAAVRLGIAAPKDIEELKKALEIIKFVLQK